VFGRASLAALIPIITRFWLGHATDAFANKICYARPLSTIRRLLLTVPLSTMVATPQL